MKKLIFLSLAFLLLASQAHATISATNLTSGTSATDATSYATASITPTANRLVLLAVTSHIAGGVSPVEPTATGNGLTWVSISTNVTWNCNLRRMTLFRAMGDAPTTGAITISFGSETQLFSTWSVVEFSNVDTSGTNGSGAIVQVVNHTWGTGFATARTETISAFSVNGNAAYGYKQHGTNEVTTPGVGFTELNDDNLNDGGLLSGNQTQWKLSDNSIDWTWATSARSMAILAEIKVEPSTRLEGSVIDASIIQ